MSSIADRIVLSEELLATAEGFVTIEKIVSDNHLDYGHLQPIIKDLEEAYVVYYTKLSSDFRMLYFGTIKKAITWVQCAEDSSTSVELKFWICLLLQGLDYDEGDEN
jgi:hypothetical protein